MRRLRSRWVWPSVLILPWMVACRAAPPVSPLDLEALGPDEGYVVARLASPRMRDDPDAIWGLDLWLEVVPLGAGTPRDLRGEGEVGVSLPLEAGASARWVILRLRAGTHVIHRVHAGGPAQDLDVRFDVLRGRVTYLGDWTLAVEAGVDGLGRTLLESLRWSVSSQPHGVPDELARVAGGEAPEFTERLARVHRAR